MAITYASSYNINFRGCSKFESGPAVLSRKCAKACNSWSWNSFFWAAPCQLAHIADIAVLTCGPAPGHTFEPAWSHRSLENFQVPGKLSHRRAPGHMSHNRLENFRGRESFSTAPPPVTAWSHKSPENFWGPGKFFHSPAWPHKSPENFWGPEGRNS